MEAAQVLRIRHCMKNEIVFYEIMTRTMAVRLAVPFLVIMLTTYPPHPKLLIATQFPFQHSIKGLSFSYCY
jgi:hypothetical protein